jgi:hypothetical protein
MSGMADGLIIATRSDDGISEHVFWLFMYFRDPVADIENAIQGYLATILIYMDTAC